MENKKIFSLGSLLVLTVLMSSVALAFGVSSPYWKGNPLQIYPGETKIVKINYQNMGVDAEDIIIRAEITKGNDIASIPQEDYTVKAGTKDTTVEVSVAIPESVPVGSKYQITLTSSSVTPGTEGGVSLGVGMDTTFDVEVVSEPIIETPEAATGKLAEESTQTTNIVLFILLAIIIIAIVILVIVKKKSK